MDDVGGGDVAKLANGHAPMMSASSSRKRYFGRRLVELRESYSDRTAPKDDDVPALVMRPTAKALIACMDRIGFQISTAAYSEIENGLNVPREGQKFIESVAKCLHLTREQEHDLALRLMYDILAPRVGNLVDKVIPLSIRKAWDR